MRTTVFAAAIAASIVGSALAPAPAAAQGRQRDENAFTWEGRVDQGAWVIVKNMNGAIRVEAATGDKVEVTASKSWRRGDPDDVRIESKRIGPDDKDVLICALWNEESRCSRESYHSSNGGNGRRSNDTEVIFTVRVPKGVRVQLATVNGGVDVAGVTSEVRAGTVNGGVDVETSSGPVSANTVNGDIRVRMDRIGGDEDLSYNTVNGSITVYLPEQIDADIEMTTVNGSLSADYPITLVGRINPRHIRARIGQGGRQMEFRTVNGSVRLVKGR
ncbi:MAG TPA: DUF4097 family beta strand repeat-containing protein [Gemmatimonadaceae bacterium]|nr:DUF4097 family beta strand repeat-containing protein [Gemmatimonadaceae bacterium]